MKYFYDIQCLKGEAVLDTRPLWEEVFSEDSASFTDYYFQKKAVCNITFVCRLSESTNPAVSAGEIVSMVHLTPYDVAIGDTICSSYYIVGVATKKSHRRRGLMRKLLTCAFSYAEAQSCPFVFLMPASPAIYEPFGFRYVYARPQYDVSEALQNLVYINHNDYSLSDLGDMQVRCLENTASPEALSRLTAFAARTLREQFDYYLVRTPSYYRTLLAELASQNGCIVTIMLNESLEGYFLYAKETETPFIQELLFSEKLRRYLSAHPEASSLFPSVQAQKKPVIMAKTLNKADNLSAANLSANPTSKGARSENAFPITDYVNYLSTHKGLINEIV